MEKRWTLDRLKTHRSLEVSLCLRKSIIWMITFRSRNQAAAGSATDGSQNGLALKCSSKSTQSIGSYQKVKSLRQIDLFQHISLDYVLQ